MERGKKRLEKLRRRREAAVKLFEQGERQSTVARSLRVSRQSVSEWWLAWRAGDTKKLKGATEAGRRPRVQPEQLTATRSFGFYGLPGRPIEARVDP